MAFLTTARVIATGHLTAAHTASAVGYSGAFTETITASAAASAGEWVFAFVADDETPTPAGAGLTEWYFTQIDHAAFSSGFGSFPYAQQQLGTSNVPSAGGPQIWGTFLEQLVGNIASGDTLTAHWTHYNPGPALNSSTLNARTYMVVAFQANPTMAAGQPFAVSGPHDGSNDDEENTSGSSSSPSVSMTPTQRAINGYTDPGSQPHNGWSFGEFAAFVWADGSTTITDPAAPWEVVGKHVVAGEHGIALYTLADVPNNTNTYTCAPTLSGAVAWSSSLSDWLTTVVTASGFYSHQRL